MPIVRITGQGLAAIAFSTALLWGCVIGGRASERHACAERARVLRELVLLQQKLRPQPVSAPVPRIPRRLRITMG